MQKKMKTNTIHPSRTKHMATVSREKECRKRALGTGPLPSQLVALAGLVNVHVKPG